MDSLMVAVESGDMASLKALLQQGECNVNDDDTQGKTLLHYACENRHLHVVRALVLEFGAVVNFMDDAGCTPLHCACQKGHIDIAKVLVHELKADMTIQDNFGKTAFHYACKNGHAAVVNALLSEFKSDSVPRDNDGLSPLHYACRKGHLDIVIAWLAKFKSDIAAEDDYGCTPWFYACEKGHLNILRALKSEILKCMEMASKFSLWSKTDIAGRSILHYASGNGHIDVVKASLFEFNEEPTKQDSQGQIPLHYACGGGYLDIVRVLVAEFKSGLIMRDKYGYIPLHSACKNGHLHVVRVLMSEFELEEEIGDADGCLAVMLSAKRQHEDVVLALLDDYKCSVAFKDREGWGVLHYACAGGSVSLVRSLMHNYITLRDDNTKTALQVALDYCHYELAFCLICEFGFDPNVADRQKKTLLHYACQRGDIDLVHNLVQKHKANVNACGVAKITPLDVAMIFDKIDVALYLICECNCNPNVSNKLGQTPLHFACKRGDLNLVRTLIHKHGADLKACTNSKKTPLDVAVSNNQFDVAFCLICEFGCDSNVANEQGQTPLHFACKMGNMDLVHALIHDHKADLYSYDKLMETPVQAAYKAGKNDVVQALISEYGCNLEVDYEGQTLLHDMCERGDLNLVCSLCKHQADVNARNKKMDTPLHIAAREGENEIVLALVKEYGCDPSAKGYLERTALHAASDCGHAAVVQSLLNFTSPLLTDRFGNTALHLAAGRNNLQCVQVLVNGNAPVLIRNNNGATPIDAARGESQAFLLEHIKDKSRLQVDYKGILEQAKKKYSGSHYIIRVFVVGYPGAGKSSFIESLKREGFFKSFSKVSESSVPPHTAGIIPSVHMSKQYGRVQFYDFAGDAEYYSSHAAIFESLASSRKGSNVFIVVVDMREDDITVKNTLHYWFSFIQYQRFKNSSFIVVGSHVDKAADCDSKKSILDQFCCAMQPNVRNIKHFLLDCRNPRSNSIAQFKKQILRWVSNKSQKCEISSEARLLLGLLRKDFSAVTACPVQTLVSHIKDSGVCIPLGVKGLHRILLELHEVGVLLLLGDCTKESDHIVLKVSKLTNEVHELLFSKSALSEAKVTSLNIGILPEEVLEEILPPYVTSRCLIHLQYCQQISHRDISTFIPMEHDDTTSQSFLFFPALCSTDKSQVLWDESSDSSFSIGWLALCTDPHDYFPPRFLHVLLLRLIHGFALSSARQKTAHASPEHSRRCIMWKNGVHWLMEEGVDCMVELVNGSKGMVVLTKSCADGAEDCTRIFTKVVSCVMEAKAEFCYSAKPEFFLLDSSAEADYLNGDHQFAMSDVERALESPEGKRVIISVSGRGKMELSKLQCMRNLTHWDSLFPVNFTSVLSVLREIVRELYELGQSLGVPRHILQAIEADFPYDVSRRRRELVRWWMSSSQDPPCWWHLVQALRRIDENVLAERIRKDHDCHICLQEKLLCELTQTLKPDEDFLCLFSNVVGSRWPSLAVSLALSEEEIEGLKEEVEFTQQELALQMLKTWASREEATYGNLFQILKKVLLFQYCIHQYNC